MFFKNQIENATIFVASLFAAAIIRYITEINLLYSFFIGAVIVSILYVFASSRTPAIKEWMPNILFFGIFGAAAVFMLDFLNHEEVGVHEYKIMQKMVKECPQLKQNFINANANNKIEFVEYWDIKEAYKTCKKQEIYQSIKASS